MINFYKFKDLAVSKPCIRAYISTRLLEILPRFLLPPLDFSWKHHQRREKRRLGLISKFWNPLESTKFPLLSCKVVSCLLYYFLSLLRTLTILGGYKSLEERNSQLLLVWFPSFEILLSQQNKNTKRVNMTKILEVAKYFCRFIEKVADEKPIRKVSKEEIKDVIFSFKKDKP